MKNTIFLFLIFPAFAFAQLSGVKTIPGNYPTIASAISALNAQGVGNGGVIFNISAGYTETLSSRLNLLATGTSSGPIIFQKSGSGPNPLITSYVGVALPTSSTPDGIWSLQGCDYVTIDGIDLYDPNTTTNTTMEYGFGLFRNNAYDGAQNNTIRNCKVTLRRQNNSSGTSPMVEGSVCILMINSTPTSATTAFAPFAPSGTNSYNKFYSDSLQNCNYGIVLTGSVAATPFDLGDTGNDVGGSLSSTGNSILNFGGGTNYNPTSGIMCINQWDLNISNNTINNNNGSGTNPTTDIYGINAVSGVSANVNINNNTVTLITNSSNYNSNKIGICNGIGSTPDSNIVNICYNTITGFTGGGYAKGIYNSAGAETVNITYNTLSNLTSYSTLNCGLTGISNVYNSIPAVNVNIGYNHLTGFSKELASLTGIYCLGQNVNCHHNLLDNFNRNSSLSSSELHGIEASSTGAYNLLITNNTIRNYSTYTTSSNGWGILVYDNPAVISVDSNQFYNFSLNNTGSFYMIESKGTISNNTVHDIHYSNSGNLTIITDDGGATISGNKMYAISNLAGTSGMIQGINSTITGASAIFNNNISNLSSANTAATVDGIYLGAGTKNIYNNFISDLKAPNSASLTAISGINVSAGGTFNVYYNSVLLNTNSTGATFGTSAIYVNTAATVDLRNNILVNTSIPNGGGYTCAYRRSGTTLTTYSNTSDKNCFYAGTPGLYRLIYYDGTNSDQTLSSYKTRVAPRDASSVSENPPFLNITTSPFNLHLSTSIPTLCESHGSRVTSPLAITTDIDGNIRWGETGYSGIGTATDIGADEGNFAMFDIDAPVITYPLLGNSCTIGDRIIVAAITDNSGIPTSGTYIPRIYYKKNSGSWFSQPGTLLSGNGNNGSWSFPILSADMGILSVGDVISYYIIAQDTYLPPNIGSNPSVGLIANNVNDVITPPSSPNSYSILNSLSGIYQVGVGKTFETITAAANAYNSPSNCLGSNPVFELTDASYSTNETFPVVFNANPFAGPGNVLTIRPAAGVTVTISGASATSIIKLNSAKYITINGSNSGSNDRNLFIVNTNSSTNQQAAVWVGSNGTGAGCNSIVIKNCTFSSGSTYYSSYGIFAGSAANLGSPGDDNDNLTILNNNIYKVKYGITVMANPTGLNNDLKIDQNIIGSSISSDYVSNTGISVTNATGASISKNTIFNIIDNNGAPTGLSIGSGVISSIVSKNLIQTVKSQYGTWARGVYLNTGIPNSNITFANNIICDIQGNGTDNMSQTLTGMSIDGNTGGLKIYYKSISLNYAYGSSDLVYTAAILFNSSTISAIDFRNNILNNAITNSANLISSNYAIYSNAPASAFTIINFNDYFANGSPAVLGYLGGNKTTLAEWQAATLQDGNSISSDPVFVSTTDLRPGIGSLVLGAATPIVEISDDYPGVTRSSTPTMGAYETGVDVLSPQILYNPLPNTTQLDERTITVTITDESGIPVSGAGLPVLYWRINSGSWIPSPGIFLGDHLYQFNFGSGVISGDIVYYYIVAQDGYSPYPNISCSPSAGAAGLGYNPPSAIIPPTTPNIYKVYIQLNGTLIIGQNGNYQNLTGGNGLFRFINENVVTGNIEAFISGDLNEEGTYALNQWTELGGSGYALTIKPIDGYNKLISGNAPGLIRFNGADRVIISGDYQGAGNYLTFRNNNLDGPVFIFQNDATYNTLTKLVIEGCNQSYSGEINIGSSTGSTGNDHLAISDCIIRDRTSPQGVTYYTAIYSNGSFGKENSEITITGNKIFNYQCAGVYVTSPGNGDNWTISNNHFYNPKTSTNTQYGIYFYGHTTSNGNLISNNYIGGQEPFCGGSPWINNGSGSVIGIMADAGTGTGISVQGNVIQNINIISTGYGNFYGLYAGYGNGRFGDENGNIVGSATVPNSITMAGTGNAYGFISTVYASSVVKNNLFANITQTGTNPGDFWGIYVNSANSFLVERNSVKDCGPASASANTKDVVGIEYIGASGGTQPCIVVNNLVSLGQGRSNNNTYKGIEDYGFAGNNLYVYHNSIYLGGTCTNYSNSYACLKRNVSNDFQKNNIYNNSRIGGSGSHYAIGNSSNSGTFSSDYNDLYSLASNLAIWNLTNEPNLFFWQEASGQDAHSVNINPLFDASLIPTTTNMNKAGIFLPQYPRDYLGNARSNPPDAGAYEFSPGATVATLPATTVTSDAALLNGSVNANTSSLTAYFDYGFTESYTETVSASPSLITGTGNMPVSAIITGLLPSSTYHFRARAVSTGGVVYYGNDQIFTTTQNSTGRSLLLTVFLESLYSGGGMMNEAKNEYGNPQWGVGIADKITVELHDPVNFDNLIFSAENISLSTSGNALVPVPVLLNGSYYVSVRHRNSIETVSAAPVSFSGSIIGFSLSSVASQAFGANLKLLPDGFYGIYGGDGNQDGVIDGSDMAAIDNASMAPLVGYFPEDITGDGIVDGSDMAMIDNNSTLVIHVQKP